MPASGDAPTNALQTSRRECFVLANLPSARLTKKRKRGEGNFRNVSNSKMAYFLHLTDRRIWLFWDSCSPNSVWCRQVKLFVAACFQKSYKNVLSKCWNLSLQIFNQLASESISFLLGQRNGSESDQLFFSLTALLHTHVHKQYKNNDNLTAGITMTNNACHHLDMRPTS
jgi:hypothetical protein